MKFHPFGSGRNWIGVLDRMIIADVAKTVAAVLSVLTLIVVSRRFLSILGKAIEGEVAGGIIFTLLGVKTLKTLTELLPVAVFISVFMVFGRMHRDNEMAILASAGLGMRYFSRAMLIFIIPLSLCAGLLSLKLLPWTEAQAQQLVTQAESVADVRGITAGQFNEYSRGEIVFFIEEIDESQQMQNIFVQYRRDDKLSIVVSQTGRIVDLPDGRYIVLEHGKRYDGEPGRADYTITEYDEYAFRISQSNTSEVKTKREGTPSMELLDSDSVKDVAEFLNRVAIPLGAIVLSLLAMPLAKVSPRGGVYGNLFMAIVIYIIYGNMLRIVEVWALDGDLSIWVGYSMLYVFMLVMAMLFMLQSAGWRLWKTQKPALAAA